MEEFFEHLMVRAATIDELLSGDFEPLPGQKGDTDRAAQRLAAWCRSSASGDWSLFNKRLERDGWSMAEVLTRLATVGRNPKAATPPWVDDAIWIERALRQDAPDRPRPGAAGTADRGAPYPFDEILTPLLDEAGARLSSAVDAAAVGNLTESARADLRHALLEALSDLCAPALYERFAALRKQAAAPSDRPAQSQDGSGDSIYRRFVEGMRAGGLRQLFEDKPVLLRLIATTTRQWLDVSREFLLRLSVDLEAIRRDLGGRSGPSRVTAIESGLSDPHNGGRCVQVVRFEDGAQVVYKPKDLRVDAAWHSLVARLNDAAPPVALKAARPLARDGYGWTEFIEHTGCTAAEFGQFFRRVGAWLALFHVFAGTDMHQENVIASGLHPVPIDLEMILQASPQEHKSNEPEAQAFETAVDVISNSVLMVGLLPSYAKSPENKVFAIGGVTSGWTAGNRLTWNNVNSDRMRPAKVHQAGAATPNLPHADGRYATFGDHVDDLIAGFADYATFLASLDRGARDRLFAAFAGLPLRKVIRPTRFYYMLLQRLKNHKTMDDGAAWSAQADFLARLADWQTEADPLWPLQHAERASLLQLNVPHFTVPSDTGEIGDSAGVSIRSASPSGLDRARGRLGTLDAAEIAWQVAVIRQNTATVSRNAAAAASAPQKSWRVTTDTAPSRDLFIAEAQTIAADLGRHAVRRGSSAAWIGLDWLGDSEVAQLVPLGFDLYNGVSGIAVFLAAHASVTASDTARDLALAAVAQLRKNLKSRNAARLARALGLGGGSGLGSIVYAFAVMAKCLGSEDLLADAYVAAGLFSDDLIAADRQLDVLGGSAGGILGLLRLYGDGRSPDVLKRAVRCADHLLAQPRAGTAGRRTWAGQPSAGCPLTGMSHGAAGYAYALASLAAATGREDFANAAAECLAMEDSCYDPEQSNWPDLRGEGAPAFRVQWCHGAPGIGLARSAIARRAAMAAKTATPQSRLAPDVLADDIRNALRAVERGWPGHIDTMCCGTLGSVEFYCAAAETLGRGELRETAAQRLLAVIESAAAAGDYRWNVGERRFNLGLFRGLAGIGYTCLRQADAGLPNVLIWE